MAKRQPQLQPSAALTAVRTQGTICVIWRCGNGMRSRRARCGHYAARSSAQLVDLRTHGCWSLPGQGRYNGLGAGMVPATTGSFSCRFHPDQASARFGVATLPNQTTLQGDSQTVTYAGAAAEAAAPPARIMPLTFPLLPHLLQR